MASKDGQGSVDAFTLELEEDSGEGPWRLEIGGCGPARSVPVAVGQALTLGARQGCEILVEDAAVSGRHAAIRASESGLEVQDLCSRNGLFVGGARVERAVLRGGGCFVVGRTRVSVRRGGGPAGVAGAAPEIPGLIGSSPPVKRLAREVRRIAHLDVPVLIVGESGTGKDVVARAIHQLSQRRGRYVALNAGALPESLADSELFGHRRGAFTGAVHAHAGAFEQADGGSLFLDEIGDLAPSVQVKLLRAVEEGEVRPLGASGTVRVNARVIAATWAPLLQRIEEGTFRADLYHRISTFVISIPPLRQRRTDIPALADSLLSRCRTQLGDKRLSAAALQRLSSYGFPGNVRELFSILYRAAALSGSPEVELHDVEAALPREATVTTADGMPDARHMLAAHGGNVSAAARSARVARSTFRSWLKRQAARET